MKKLFPLLISCILTFKAAPYCFSETIYVGTDESYTSIKDALEHCDGGETILLTDLYHKEESIIENMIFDDAVTIASITGQKTTLLGTDTLRLQWEQHSSNIYKAKVGQEIWQLFKEGQEMIPARWPNASFEDLSVFNQNLWAKPNNYKQESNGTVLDNDLSIFAGKDLTNVMAVLNHGSFKSYARQVQQLTTNSFQYNIIPVHEYRTNHQQYYFLEGGVALIDVKNEWCYIPEQDTLYIYAESIEELNEAIFTGKTQSYALQFNSCKNIELYNIDFFATTFKLTSTTNFTIASCKFSHPNCSKRMLGSEDLQEITHIQNDLLLEEDNKVKIENCIFENSDGGGLRIRGNSIRVIDNLFKNIDWSACAHLSLGSTICAIGSKNNQYINNTIHTTGTATVILPGESCICKYNRVFDYGRLQSDGSAIQCTRYDVDQVEISYNWFFLAPSHYGIRFDAPPDEVEVAGKNGTAHHNVIWNTNGMMIKGNDQKIYNNTVLINKQNGIIILNESGSNSRTISHNNLVEKMSGHRSKYIALPGISSNNWNGYTMSGSSEGLIVNKSLLNFSPLATSSAIIDQGILFEEYQSDFETIGLPDIGAYEYGGEYWQAGISWLETYNVTTNTPITDIDRITDIEDNLHDIFESINIHPNPSSDICHIDLGELNVDSFELTLCNINGKVLETAKSTSTHHTIDVSHYPTGIYFLTITTKNKVINKKLVIK